ncbi:Myb-like_DNA-binding domain-containing protein [Hexamita inflata]|uniref:Myb-like DNA-binding domain-containing protein n=1 Tax=Hexamita inflata TaxID=28002 RepID=A0AA86TP91_9EUKA|nr:Myb-like DNA-binding domain-containing protein [Hexamita inflata]
MNKTITKWTDSDKQQLGQLVKQYTIKNRTNWIQIAQIMKRTPNQCKTYYQVVLGQLNYKNCNMQWHASKWIQFVTCVAIYGKKWELIRKLEFQDCSAEQLRQRYLQFQNKKQYRANIALKMLNCEQVNPKDFSQQSIDFFKYLYKIYFKCEKPIQNMDEIITLKIMNLNDEQINVKQVIQKIYDNLPPLYKKQCDDQ